MPEAGILTINDLLAGKNLAGKAQEDLATRTLQSKKLQITSKNQQPVIAPAQLRDIPAHSEQSKNKNIPDTGYQTSNTNYQIPDTKDQQAAGASLREQVLQAKKQEREKEDKEGEKKEGTAGAETAKAGTGWLLKGAWLNLIDTFGLTLIYINIHVFLRFVLGEKLFCKLGQEWAPKELEAAGGEASKVLSKNAGIAEAMLLILLDFIAGVIIFGVLALIVMIVTWMGASWWRKLIMLWQAIWNLGWTAIKVLIDLF